MRKDAVERRAWGPQGSDVGRRFWRKTQRSCEYRHRSRGEEQRGGADDGRCEERRRKSHRVEAEAVEKTGRWAGVVRPDGWTGEIQRHNYYREEQRGGADDGRCEQRQRKSRRREEEEVADEIRRWARSVRADGWTGEIQRTLIALAVKEVRCDFALVWQQRFMEGQKQGLLIDEAAWVAPRRKQRQWKWHPERAHGSIAAQCLPWHLILGRLPVRQLCQLPCVCKAWDVMLEAGEVQIHTNVKREEYWFVVAKPSPHPQDERKFMAVSSHSDAQGRKDWAFFRPPLPSQSHSKLLSLLGGLDCSLLSKREGGKPRLVSTGGLMCTFVRRPGAARVYDIIVFNCLTGSVKVLPQPLDLCHLFGQRSAGHSWTRLCHMQMAIDDVDPARYYIMLTHNENNKYVAPTYFEIFDSRSGSWKVGRPPEVATSNCKVADGDFFHRSCARTPTLFAYHASDDVWSKVEIPERGKDEYGNCFTFLKYKGRLLQSVILRLMDKRVCLGSVVRELQMASSQHAVWLEVARTPQHLWHWLPYAEWDAETQAEGSLFYMTIQDRPKWGRSKPPLVYDIAQNNWYVLPSERGTASFGCILVHRPRLSMRMPPLEEEADEASVPLPNVGEGSASFTHRHL